MRQRRLALDSEQLEAGVGGPGGRPGGADHVQALGLHVRRVGDGAALAPPRRGARRPHGRRHDHHRAGAGRQRLSGGAAPGQHQPGARERAALERVQRGVARARAVEARRGVEPDRVRQAARVGQHRRRGRADHERARSWRSIAARSARRAAVASTRSVTG